VLVCCEVEEDEGEDKMAKYALVRAASVLSGVGKGMLWSCSWRYEDELGILYKREEYSGLSIEELEEGQFWSVIRGISMAITEEDCCTCLAKSSGKRVCIFVSTFIY